jgi:type VI secretion system secreted protein VgrG
MFEDKKDSEKIRMHAQKDHEVVILNLETTKIGEDYRDGDNSRTTELIHGGDSLTLDDGDQTILLKTGDQSTTLNMGDRSVNLKMGDQQFDLDLGSHTTNAMQAINLNVMMGLSSVTITPVSVSITAPEINLTAEATINLTAPIINITGVVNITGLVNITGGLTVDGMVPMLLPA